MPQAELKLDLPCPRCGTSNLPTAQRCRQCFHGFEQDLRPTQPALNLFDWTRPVQTCPACGKANPFGTEVCLDCGAAIPPPDDDLGGQPLQELEASLAKPRLRNAVKDRRRQMPATLPAWLNPVFLVRLAAVLLLFGGVIDTSNWLTHATQQLAPNDPSGLHFSIFAIYELVRNICLAGGLWLLTLLNFRR